MSFQECLNKYITQIQCNGRELARNSGISETVISRYRNGERAPSADSEYLKKLADGIIKTAEEKEIRDFDGRNIFQTLRDSLETEKQGQEFNGQKLDILLKELNINISRLAAFLHYDPSYLSKLRTGKRAPAHQQEFIDKVCSYIAINCREDTDKKKVAFLTGCQEKELTEPAEYKKALEDWMMFGNNIKDIDYVAGFLHKVDDFNLDEYIRAVHFDSFKVPKVPFQLPVSRHYYGLEEMREGELDFLKHTVLSKSMQDLYMCSDMPIEDMATDKEFAKKYMFGLALVLKRGLHIHIIHNVERPMKDMLLGLENWVPLYMTGQISPYYIRGIQNQVYSHLHYCSGQVAMTGDCISGHHDLAHYYLTSHKEEVEISRKNMKFLLRKARPLMDIYRAERKNELDRFLLEEVKKEGRRRRILSSLPLALMSDKLTEKILNHNKVSDKERKLILECRRKEKERMETILMHSLIEDEVAQITREEYKKYPLVLSLSECFLEKDICLSYEEYLEGIQDAQEYTENHNNYILRVTQTKGFRNIQVSYFDGEWCMVSKNRVPAIHFIIYHPKLRYAMENMILPIRD